MVPELSPTCHHALIVTALPLELAAVMRHLTNRFEQEDANGTIYECGRFDGANARWSVTVVETGPGNLQAAVFVERAIGLIQPEVVVMVGVAGGLKDVAIGDVVVGDKVYWAESGKEADDGFRPRPTALESSHRAIQRSKSCARSTSWLDRIGGRSVDQPPRALVGPIAAVEKVVATTDSMTYDHLRRLYSDALAVEMESAGMMRALQAHAHLERLIVRGVSDLVAGKNEADAGGSQPRAAANAAAFAFEILSTLSLPTVPSALPMPVVARTTRATQRHAESIRVKYLGGASHGQAPPYGAFLIEVTNAGFDEVQLFNAVGRWYSGDQKYEGSLRLSNDESGARRKTTEFPDVLVSGVTTRIRFELDARSSADAGLGNGGYLIKSSPEWETTERQAAQYLFLRCSLHVRTREGEEFAREFDQLAALPDPREPR